MNGENYTQFNETMSTSGFQRNSEEAMRSLRVPCMHGTPVFQSQDKDEARKEGLHKTRGRGRRKRRETVRAKEVRKPKVEGYRREGEYKARYASQSRGDSRRREKKREEALPSLLRFFLLSLRMTSPSLSERTGENEGQREDTAREEKRERRSPLNDVRSRVVNIRLYGCR